MNRDGVLTVWISRSYGGYDRGTCRIQIEHDGHLLFARWTPARLYPPNFNAATSAALITSVERTMFVETVVLVIFLCLSVLLLLACIAALRGSAQWERYHRLYALAEIALVAALGVYVSWDITVNGSRGGPGAAIGVVVLFFHPMVLILSCRPVRT